MYWSFARAGRTAWVGLLLSYGLTAQVRLYSRRWAVLKSGAVLVDAPGVHDDNSARDVVVKKKLKDADAVWIVSNIVRAVNDKTAKDLLGEQASLPARTLDW